MLPLIGSFTGIAMFIFGTGIGRLSTRPPRGAVTVGWREMWRHGPSPLYRRNPKSMRVLVGAFGAACGAFGLNVLADYLRWKGLAFFAFFLMAFSIGLVWGIFLFHRSLKEVPSSGSR